GTKDNPYNSMNEGINAASEKYTVLVAAGTYEESVTIDKDIRLIGESPSTTIIDAGAAANAIIYDYLAGEISCIEGFAIRNADNGINCANGASPLIRNNIITGIGTSGIIYGYSSTAKIINNTISGNTDATAIQSSSSDMTVVNNIITGNDIGIDSDAGLDPRIDYNNVWSNTGSDYVGCEAGIHDISDDPSFADIANSDFHLANGSPCLDAGDPVEELAADCTGGSTITVDEVTNMEIGDRIRITDGVNSETDVVVAVSETTIEIQGEFMNDYLVTDGAYIFTDTSDASKEPEPGNYRIDMGAYGNTPEAGSTQEYCYGDLDGDGDVDGSDLSEFAIAYSLGEQRADLNGDTFVDSKDLALFAANFGRTNCPERPKGDLDSDGDVDGHDLAEFTMAYALDEQRADLNGDGRVNSNDIALFAASFGVTGL
ncbi:MAG: right-handed parallel beta-helix repeat-containing protein, partial [Desulfobacterales bacterium]|nr:right-handed parallel beta-helix repeat-containing protein [Desulfobacterales bacterium]